MVHEIIYALVFGTLLGIGAVGLFYSPAFHCRLIKPLMIFGSVLIILTGLYFFQWWHEKRGEIQVLSQRIEYSLSQVPAQE